MRANGIPLTWAAGEAHRSQDFLASPPQCILEGASRCASWEKLLGIYPFGIASREAVHEAPQEAIPKGASFPNFPASPLC